MDQNEQPKRAPRHELEAAGELKEADELFDLDVRNISESGVLLASGGRDLSGFPVGSRHELVLFDSRDESNEEERVTVTAVVARHSDDGMALTWSGDERAMAAIRRLIDSLS